MLPESLNIASKNISSILIFSLLGLFCWIFVLWGESKKDGFNTQRFFDLIFISLILSSIVVYLVSSLLSWLRIYHPYNSVLALDQEIFLSFCVFTISLLPVFYFYKKYKWSVFRVLDIYSAGFSMFLMFLSLGRFLVSNQREYLFLLISLVVIYGLVIRRRGYRFRSGTVFSVFNFFIGFSLFLYFKKGGSLLFALILVTIGVVNLYFRGKKSMSKNILPEHFIENLKKRLLSKEKRLSEQQQSLIQNDPYLQQGRATDNSEVFDDVLEDTGKNTTDAVLSNVRSVKVQVRKALARMKIGKYGKCEVCGKEIDKARLEVYPEATTCIECATDHSQNDEIKEDEILEKNI